MIGALFFAAWRRIVKNAGGAGAIPLPAWLRKLLPDGWQGKVDDKIGGVGQ
jgi:hypothetical protein